MQVARPPARAACQAKSWPARNANACVHPPPIGLRGSGAFRNTLSPLHPTTPARLQLARAVATEVAEIESPSATLASQTEQQQSSDKFQWTQHWYPVMVMDGLDPKVPRHVDLLGKSLVVWADSRGAWHCLEDLCPHRLAPLSEGRVEKDSLQCSYHGWTFNSQGACDNIPQIPPGPARDKACGDRKACVRSYPTSVSQGLLWVWSEAGSDAAKRAAEKTAGQHVESKGYTPWYRREVPNRFVTQLENVLDPAHVPFAHHGVQGDRKVTARHLIWAALEPPQVHEEGFTGSVTTKAGAVGFTFQAPCTVKYTMGSQVFFRVLVVPSRPGYSVMYGSRLLATPFAPEPRRTLDCWKENTWWGQAMSHMLVQSGVIDGDSYMLHLAERKQPLSQGVGMRAIRDYFVPGRFDGGVLAFRQWMTKYGGEVPTCTPADAALEPPLLPKEQVLDRYHQHTKDCAHCKRMLTTIDGARAVASVVAVASAMAALAAGVAAAVLPRLAGPSAASASAWGPVGAWWHVVQQAGLHPIIGAGLLLAAGAALLHSVLGKWRQKAFYEEYVHALRD